VPQKALEKVLPRLGVSSQRESAHLAMIDNLSDNSKRKKLSFQAEQLAKKDA